MGNLKAKILSALRWSEKYTKTDMVYLTKGSFWLNSGQVLSAIFGFGLTIVFANMVEPATYGIYRYVLSVYSIFIIFSLPGADSSATRSVSQGFEGTLTQAMRSKLNWSVLGSIISFTFASYQYSKDNIELFTIFVLIAIFLPFMEGFSPYIAYLNGKKLFKEWTLIDTLTQGVAFITTLLVATLTDNLITLISAYFVPNIIARIIATSFVKKNYVSNTNTDQSFLEYSKSLTLLQAMSKIMGSIDQIVVFSLAGPVQVAMFSLAYAIPSRIQSMFRSTGILAFPKFAEKSDQEILRELPKKMFLMGGAIILVCIIYYFISPLVFSYLFPKYLPSLPYSRVIILFTLSAITYPFASFLLAHKKIKESYFINVTNLSVKIIILAICVPLYGVWGAVWSVIGSSFSTIIISFVLIYKMR